MSRANIYDVGGEKLTLKEMSQRCGINVRALGDRIKRGMTPEKAMTAPFRNGGRKRSYTLRGERMTMAVIAEALYTNVTTLMCDAKKSGMDIQEYIDAEAARFDEMQRKTAAFLADLKVAGEAVKRRRQG